MMSSTISCQTAIKMAVVERMWCDYITPLLPPTATEEQNLLLERRYDYLADLMLTAGARECRREMLELRRYLLRLEDLRERNSRRDLMPTDCDDDTADPPLS